MNKIMPFGNQNNNRLSFRAALGLGAITQLIYFPVIVHIYANVLPDLTVLVGPALIGIVFNTVFIIGVDRALERLEKMGGSRIQVDSQVPGIILSIFFSLIAIFISQYLFSLVLDQTDKMLGGNVQSAAGGEQQDV